MPDESVHCVVTSPPYFGLRDYGVAGQIGLEETPSAFVAEMVSVFREVRRVLRKDGTLWLNLGDSYAGSWGAQGRQGATGQMSGRSVADVRERSKISAAQISAHPQRMSQTGTIREPGLKPKDLIGVPWRVALALQADGWWLRQDIIWHKPNPMPESITDRCTKAHEYIFLLTKSERYFYDSDAVAEPVGEWSKKALEGRWMRRTNYGTAEVSGRNEAGMNYGSRVRGDALRNLRSVWTVATQPFSGAHFATFPPDLIEPCIKAGCPAGGTVLDPFGGAGTTGLVADRLGRDAILIELNPAYAEMARDRLRRDAGMFADIRLVSEGSRPAPASVS
jgi:DNA modification methylase